MKNVECMLIINMKNYHIFQWNLSRKELRPQATFWSTTWVFYVDLDYIIKN